eukprot:7485190-Alexandrium_andersonii.AAC.1
MRSLRHSGHAHSASASSAGLLSPPPFISDPRAVAAHTNQSPRTFGLARAGPFTRVSRFRAEDPRLV